MLHDKNSRSGRRYRMDSVSAATQSTRSWNHSDNPTVGIIGEAANKLEKEQKPGGETRVVVIS